MLSEYKRWIIAYVDLSDLLEKKNRALAQEDYSYSNKDNFKKYIKHQREKIVNKNTSRSKSCELKGFCALSEQPASMRR